MLLMCLSAILNIPSGLRMRARVPIFLSWRSTKSRDERFHESDKSIARVRIALDRGEFKLWWVHNNRLRRIWDVASRLS